MTMDGLPLSSRCAVPPSGTRLEPPPPPPTCGHAIGTHIIRAAAATAAEQAAAAAAATRDDGGAGTALPQDPFLAVRYVYAAAPGAPGAARSLGARAPAAASRRRWTRLTIAAARSRIAAGTLKTHPPLTVSVYPRSLRLRRPRSTARTGC